MIQEQYRHLMDQVGPGEELLHTVTSAARQGERGRSRRPRAPALALAAACLCLMLAIPALAAVSEGAYSLLYSISPATAQFFRPVNLVDEDNGIQMEVVSAYIHENTAEIYIALRDLTGERVDETIDLFDSYFIRGPFDSEAGCRLAGYDRAARTAYFLLQIQQWGEGSIAGDKITFTVREFLSGKQTYENLEIPIDLSAVAQGERTQDVDIIGGSGDGYAALAEGQAPAVLEPGAAREDFPVEGIGLTGIGYVDGKLHIQTAVEHYSDNDNHGYFYLRAPDGTEQRCSYSVSFVNHGEPEGRVQYFEYVFEIPQEQLSQYTLYGNFVTCSQKVQGNWSVTFPLEQEKT